MMIKESQHHIGELIRIVREKDDTYDTYLRFRSVKTGHYLNFFNGVFEDVDGTGDVHNMLLDDLLDTGLVSYQLSTMHPATGEFLAEFWTGETIADAVVYHDAVGYEIHRFGGTDSVYEPSKCRVYGYIRDVSGAPVVGQRVDVVLSNGGYFPHKSGLISTSAYALSNSSGYFELELVHGLDVVISIPSIGFTEKGIIPPVASVEVKNLMGRV